VLFRSPKPQTPNPKPQTPNPKPQTPNPLLNLYNLYMSNLARIIPNTLREIRFIVSSSRVTNLGLTEYLNRNLSSIRSSNPKLKVLLRECEGIDDYIIFRSTGGREDRFYLEHVDQSNLEEVLTRVVKDLK
jgi:hypothetical protein